MAGIAAGFAFITPIAAYIIGRVWIVIAMRSDLVPQNAMLGAFLLFAGVAFIAVPTLLYSLVEIAVEEMGKRKRGKHR